jgi:CheY-like chemotaxis protein
MRGPSRVLVVDDNEEAADGLAEVLRGELGCDVYTAYDGAEALDKAGELHPDVVVMDITMPHVDGYEAAGLLRRVFRHKTPRLIAVTGHATEHDAQLAHDCGFDQLLGKPVRMDQLIAAVRAHL